MYTRRNFLLTSSLVVTPIVSFAENMNLRNLSKNSAGIKRSSLTTGHQKNMKFMKTTNYPSEWLHKINNETIFSTQNGLPGAVITACIDGKLIFKKAYGFQRKYNELDFMPTPEPMREDTIFDLASLTKIFSTTIAYMKLVDDGKVNIEDNVNKYLKTFTGGDKDKVRIKHLMQHTSGLPASFEFYNPEKVPPEFYSQTREKTVEIAPLVPLINKPNTVTVYSDINFLLLGIILEKIVGIKQDIFVETNIYQPLGLKYTGYMLMEKGIAKDKFEATERCGNTRDGRISFPNIRTKTIQGQVQDETAFYAMEQISGNAGLFSTAEELSVLCQLILNGGKYGSFSLYSQKTSDLFISTLSIDKSYGLGFQIPNYNTQLIYGLLLPEAGYAVAHTGWTGKCFVIDFTNKSFIIILNNKKHSPVIPVSNDLNHFEADLLPTSIYGSPVQMFYAGLLSRPV